MPRRGEEEHRPDAGPGAKARAAKAAAAAAKDAVSDIGRKTMPTRARADPSVVSDYLTRRLLLSPARARFFPMQERAAQKEREEADAWKDGSNSRKAAK